MRQDIKYGKGVEKKVSSHKEAVALLSPSFYKLEHEEVWTLYLNTVNDPIVKSISTIGTINSVQFDIRRIVKEAIMNNASGIIVSHNHPSGDVRPSFNDIEETKTLKESLKLFDISLVDHLIISDNNYYSFAEQNTFTL